MDELHDAWEPVLAVELDIQSVHHTAQQVRMVAPNENVITLCFRVRVADQTGDFSLCLPVRAIQKMISKLSVNEPPSLQPSPTHFQSQANSESVSLRVVMGTVDVEDFDSLSSGDLIETDLCTDSSVTILADGVEKFVGRPGCAHGKKAVVIERVRAE